MSGGPSHAYLAQLAASLKGSGQAREVGGDVNGFLPPMVPDAGGGYPALGQVANAPPPPPPGAPFGPPPPPPGTSSPNEDPIGLVGRAAPAMSQGPSPQYHVGEEPAPEAKHEPPRDDVIVRPVGGGKGTPAHEAMNKGPQQLGHYMAAFDAQEGAAHSQNLRTQLQASREEAMYAEEANAAHEREVQAQASIVRRQEEMRQREDQFRDQVDMLSQQHLDQGRYFANMGTGEKIATTILLGIGGGLSMIAGPNAITRSVNKSIDRDVDAQKFDYDAGLTRAKNLHTAYSMLMDRYHEEDIARAGARTAALDYTLARANGMRAQWKGTESANALDAVVGKLGADRENTMGNATTLVAATAGGGANEVWVRGRGGMHKLAGLKTNAEADKIDIEHNIKQREKTDDEDHKGDIASTLQDQKARAAAAKQKANGKNPDNLYATHMAFLDNAENNLVEGTGKGLNGKPRRADIPGSGSSKVWGSTLAGGVMPDAQAYEAEIDAYNANLLTMLKHWTKDEDGRPDANMARDLKEAFKLTTNMRDNAANKAHKIQLAREYVQQRALSSGASNAGSVPTARTPDRADDLIDEAP